MNILFISSSLNFPIHLKRINWFYDKCKHISALGFYQDFGPPIRPPDFEHKYLGTIIAGHYLRRLWKIFINMRKIRCATKKAEVLYAFGLDGLILSLTATMMRINKPKIVCEIHDIRQLMTGNSLKRSFARHIEKTMLKRVELVVVTAEGYIREYYCKKLELSPERFFLLENKMWPDETRKIIRNEPNCDTLTIGYFGSLRCTESWKALVQIAKKLGNSVNIYIRGFENGLPNFKGEIQSNENIHYAGSYCDPDDLNEMYGKIDLIWAAGFHGKDSHRWARSCRFYNACCYAKPIISQAGTDESKIVESLGIGIGIDLEDLPATIESISNLDQKTIHQWQVNMKSLPCNIYVYEEEHNKLFARLLDLTTEKAYRSD